MNELQLTGTPFGTTYKRTTPRPMDSSEVFNTIEDARVYAKNANKAYVPYPGQIISIKGGSVYKLVIDPGMPDDSAQGVFHCKLDIVGGQNDNDDRYVRKDIAETIEKLMTFIEGINVKGTATLNEITLLRDIVSENFSGGSTGFGIYQDKAGNYHLDIDFVNIRRKMTVEEIQVNRSYYVGGKQWITPGGGIVCNKVVDVGAVYRCYFKSTDADGCEVKCFFQPSDLAICQTFNLTKQSGGVLGNRYYWRLVAGVGTDYIDLSKTDCDAGSVVPEVGDEIVHLGNKTETSRQGAISNDSITDGGPYIRVYNGINDYHLPQPKIDLNPEVSTIKAKFISEATGKNYDDIIDTLQTNVDIVREQADKEYTLWFFDYEPTLNNIPASDWTTAALKTLHEQDMFYNRESGLAWRFEKNANGTYSWNSIADQDTIRALEKASKAQDTADSKRRVFVEQPTSEDAYDIGDLWVNATYEDNTVSYKNDSLVCKTAKKKGTAFSISHWGYSSSATTAYLENLGNSIVIAVTDSEKGIEAAKTLANKGISDASKAAESAVSALSIAQSAESVASTNTSAINVMETSISALVDKIGFDDNGKITNIKTSGLVTTADFSLLYGKEIVYDENGHVDMTKMSGLVTEAGFAQMFSERAEADGYAKRAEISTFITETEAGRLISNAVISADQIRFNGNIVANDTFMVDVNGNMTLNNVTANNLTLSGDIIGNNATLNDISLNNANIKNGKIGGFILANGRIGADTTAQGSGGGLAIYDNFFRVGGTSGYAMFGDDVIPATAGGAFTATGRIVNNHPNTFSTYGFDQANYGLFISVSGGTKNYGISSDAALKAPAFINTKAELLTFGSGDYSVDFSQRNIILMYYNQPNYSGTEVTLPTEASVARQFGVSSLPNDFATMVTFRVRPGSKSITLLGIYNHNEGLVNYKMEAGDSIIVLITKVDGFRYQILNHSN
ncbi:hypothetical protein [Bacteroides sp. 51]|uniref:hypothetical protein n=1 Tax=Bacteroides sp. 51 TaxID=2302938 RepID=UPI00194022B0|nr:hypothetical protein [Bacteroides sp. 51]